MGREVEIVIACVPHKKIKSIFITFGGQGLDSVPYFQIRESLYYFYLNLVFLTEQPICLFSEQSSVSTAYRALCT